MFDKLSDQDLIKEVKEKQDSKALEELVNRHTGVYVSVIERYTYVPEVQRQDLIDSKMFNIYQAALNYKPEKGMKFSSYVGECAKYECKTLISHKVETEEVSDNMTEEVTQKTDFELCNAISARVEQCLDKRFVFIFKQRHLQEKKSSWRAIGNALGLTPEGARYIYFKQMGSLKKEIPSII